ncbi:hypothetical protein SMMN14_03111 [Sphaerulina musiva]
MDHNSSSGSSKMKEYLCPHCGGNFRSGPGLCSHEKARLAKDGVCSDSRRGDWTSSQPESTECPYCEFACNSRAGLASHERARRNNGGYCKESRLRSSGSQIWLSAPRDPTRHDTPIAQMPTTVETPRTTKLRSNPPSTLEKNTSPLDITDVPPGQEGMWKVNPVTGKRILSSISGLPMLDPKSRDYVANEARKYTPWMLNSNGKLF